MRSDQSNPSKHRYDITMSKRTRKPLLNLPEEAIHNNAEQESFNIGQGEEEFLAKLDHQGGGNGRKSLKQLINGINIDHNRGRSSLGQHFSEEENQLQLVRKQKQQGLQYVKFKGMMGRYVKVLSHCIKLKRDSMRLTNLGSRKNPFLRLPM